MAERLSIGHLLTKEHALWGALLAAEQPQINGGADSKIRDQQILIAITKELNSWERCNGDLRRQSSDGSARSA